ncbi:hypothetical protein C5E45_17825 [Nocardia nova]|uniref:Uncharacterized protein n=1 Tax=Nocardia nova TaxID=37330 RepID=A0A2S6APB6_9NOCA|nr:hypothetical protein [Nocardia nova]PPJ28814.1 hypothetical protein C5E41_12140 [Nocardia nova]PPJ37068.1 hypothetical protein C5E45_17825 [Nocardia nova]
MDEGSKQLPQRLVKVEFGKGRPPTLMYTASPDVIARVPAALKNWNPDYTVDVEPLEGEDHVPPQPLWCLRAWAN